jgi:hypothetical protein
MRDSLITPLLAALGTKETSRTDAVVRANCPAAWWTHQKKADKTPSFAIWRGVGAKCNCFSCNAPHDLVSLVWQMRGLNKQDPSGIEYDFAKAIGLLEKQEGEDPLIAEDDFPTVDELALLPPKNQVVVFPESYMDKFEDAYTETEVHPYLAGRAIDCKTARMLDLKWDPKDQRVCFPVRDFHGRLCGVHGRSVVGADLVYRVYRWKEHANSNVWLGEHWLDFDRSVVIVESVFDLAAVWPIWSNIITPRMAGFPEDALKRLDGVTHVVTLGDNDKAGDMFRARLSAMKGAHVDHASIHPFKDPGKAGEENPELIRERLAQFLDFSQLSLASSVPF